MVARLRSLGHLNGLFDRTNLKKSNDLNLGFGRWLRADAPFVSG